MFKALMAISLTMLVVIVSVAGFSIVRSLTAAPADGMTSPCDQVSTESGRSSCWNVVAYKTLDESLCERSTTFNTICLTDIAKAKRDYTICRLVNQIEDRENCYAKSAEVIPELTICSQLVQSQKYKDICYLNFVHNTKQVSVCARIVGEDIKNRCYEYIERQ